MPDSNIGALPLAPSVADDSLLVMEQQGTAMKVTGYLLKDYAKQGVELEFQDYLDEAKQAAESASGAVSAVTGMTVSAHASDTATVTKSTQAGKVNLDFGLPKGEQGEPGPPGETGPRGPQGAPGTGLTLLGHYDTEDALRAAVTSPEVGDPYGVGEEAPYDVYVFDGVTLDWKNYGQLSGGGGSILPENVVTTPGGAELEFSSGDGPHTVSFDIEEEPPLTAEDIVYGDKTVQDAISELFTSGSEGKSLIASAVTAQGVETAADATFAELAENIGKISTGSDTSDATATPGDILAPKTAYTKSGKVEGVIPSLPAQTITPGTADKTIANGQYLAGTQTIKGDTNLTSSNIKKGVSIFGVAGAMESSFAATLTVKADIGAVVTATCGDTSVEALSTTGTVVMELPVEGTWKVTALRGMAQYNTVTLAVSNQYNAELTAEVFIEYYKTAAPLSTARYQLAAATVGNYALFGGGYDNINVVDAYDVNLTHSIPSALSEGRHDLAAATVGGYALFGGGYTWYSVPSYGNTYFSYKVDAYDVKLTRSTPSYLATNRTNLAAATVGNYALFGGGQTGYQTGYNAYTDRVDAYNASLTRSGPSGLNTARQWLAAAAVGDYALFGGGYGISENTYYLYSYVDAYNASLTRSAATNLRLPRSRLAAASVGKFALFGGGNSSSGQTTVVDAYDANLTRSTPMELSVARSILTAVTIGDYALFAGGNNENGYSSVVDVYDSTLTRTVGTNLSLARYSLAATSVGSYGLFGGGRNSETCDTVDVYRRV